MKSKKNETIFCLIAICTLLIGCDAPTPQTDSGQKKSSHSESDAHPNLALHKPKTFKNAIQRLKQMHESLLANGEFPSPISIQYVEVIHGEGAGAHSHFYPAESYDKTGGNDDHHEDDEKVKRRSTEVTLRAELTDVVGWLPDIAAKSKLNEADWNSVNSTSSRLTKIIAAIAADASDNSFRESWKLKSEEIESMLDELQTFVVPSSGAAE